MWWFRSLSDVTHPLRVGTKSCCKLAVGKCASSSLSETEITLCVEFTAVNQRPNILGYIQIQATLAYKRTLVESIHNTYLHHKYHPHKAPGILGVATYSLLTSSAWHWWIGSAGTMPPTQVVQKILGISCYETPVVI